MLTSQFVCSPLVDLIVSGGAEGGAGRGGRAVAGSTRTTVIQDPGLLSAPPAPPHYYSHPRGMRGGVGVVPRYSDSRRAEYRGANEFTDIEYGGVRGYAATSTGFRGWSLFASCGVETA